MNTIATMSMMMAMMITMRWKLSPPKNELEP
jgi:hypothetical protein